MASTPESNTMEAEEVEVTSVRQCTMSRRDPPPRPPAEIEVEFPLVRQSSIYSLTLDEIQNTVCEPGKTFGSMNMDEFLTNIWNVEEGFDAAAAAAAAQAHHAAAGGPAPPLNRQGSLSLPSPLCRKTVDEVWSEIRREQQQGRRLQLQQQSRKPTFGEMTLEDFLIKAGVVREGYGPVAVSSHAPSPKPLPPTPAAAPQQYGLAGYSMGAEVAQGFGYGGGQEENGRRREVYCYGSGGGGMQMGMVGSPGSPVSSDGMCEGGRGGGQLDVYGFGMDGVLSEKNGGGRKRVAEGTLEKVVERRQRRMIKNRESAARSRARKQAYTVELEAELNHLKEENARLREEERRVRQMRKQMILEAMAEQARTNMNKTGRTLRRCHSSPS